MTRLDSKEAVAKLPAGLRPLGDLALNMWWSWNREVGNLCKGIDPVLWKETRGNPMRFVKEVEPEKLERAARDEATLGALKKAKGLLDTYLENRAKRAEGGNPIAYLSMEYALHETLPLYSGGLGVLSGDHLKSASSI